MKNWALHTFLLFAAIMPCAAQNNFYVSDPQRWGGQVQGNIDSAVLEIRPAGAYIELGLELTISTKGTSYNRQSDTVEAVLNFTLPKGSIMHDSWLWVGNDIMQGLLLERGEATDIYEGIVNRRKDPSLLFKNSETSYQLRVFPVAGHEPRKLKLTYLVPAKFSMAQMMATLPLDLLKTSRTVPSLTLVVNTNPTFMNPEVVGNLSLLLVGPDADGRYITTLSAGQLQSSTLINVAYDSPLQNGMFMAYYPHTPQSGYYQLVVNQELLTAGQHPPKKVALVLHHELGKSNMDAQEIMY